MYEKEENRCHDTFLATILPTQCLIVLVAFGAYVTPRSAPQPVTNVPAAVPTKEDIPGHSSPPVETVGGDEPSVTDHAPSSFEPAIVAEATPENHADPILGPPDREFADSVGSQSFSLEPRRAARRRGSPYRRWRNSSDIRSEQREEAGRIVQPALSTTEAPESSAGDDTVDQPEAELLRDGRHRFTSWIHQQHDGNPAWNDDDVWFYVEGSLDKKGEHLAGMLNFQYARNRRGQRFNFPAKVAIEGHIRGDQITTKTVRVIRLPPNTWFRTGAVTVTTLSGNTYSGHWSDPYGGQGTVRTTLLNSL